MDERSIASLVKDIVGNLQEIIRGEVRLAKVEVREELAKARRAVVMLAAGGIFGVLAIAFLLMTGRDLLATVVQPWLATLIVAAGAAAIAGLLVVLGSMRVKRVALPPPQTISSVQESLRWAKAPTK
jgi:uncharacterized membrane protein YqjE